MVGSAVVTPPTRADEAMVERAVFTSIRSPMGVGYQIIAASTGITADEKREIVRCAPSHGSLCDGAAEAAGLASFALGSGRQCVLVARHAGVEPTARGGYRVLTHVLVMEPAHFARFGWNPPAVEDAAIAALGDGLREVEPGRLELLVLRSEPDSGFDAAADVVGLANEIDAERVVSVATTLLAGRAALVVGAPAPRETLRATLAATPAARRRRLSLSYGMKISPARRFELVLGDATATELKRIIADRDVYVVRWNAPLPPAEGDYVEWTRFAQEKLGAQRIAEMARVAAAMTDDCSENATAEVVRLVEDQARVATADAAMLDVLTQRHLSGHARAPQRLVDDLRAAVRLRRAELEEAQRAAQAAADEAESSEQRC